jgi:hypothetical protein
MGCLSVSAVLDRSDLVRPDLTLIHVSRIRYHMEHGVLLSLGAANIQLISSVLRPLS